MQVMPRLDGMQCKEGMNGWWRSVEAFHTNEWVRCRRVSVA